MCISYTSIKKWSTYGQIEFKYYIKNTIEYNNLNLWVLLKHDKI